MIYSIRPQKQKPHVFSVYTETGLEQSVLSKYESLDLLKQGLLPEKNNFYWVTDGNPYAKSYTLIRCCSEEELNDFCEKWPSKLDINDTEDIVHAFSYEYLNKIILESAFKNKFTVTWASSNSLILKQSNKWELTIDKDSYENCLVEAIKWLIKNKLVAYEFFNEQFNPYIFRVEIIAGPDVEETIITNTFPRSIINEISGLFEDILHQKNAGTIKTYEIKTNEPLVIRNLYLLCKNANINFSIILSGKRVTEEEFFNSLTKELDSSLIDLFDHFNVSEENRNGF